jgi:hypothetical protein
MPLALDCVAMSRWMAIAAAPLAKQVTLARRMSGRINARHSGGFQQRSWSSRNPVPCTCGSFKVQGFHSPCGRACHFLCLCKESDQRNTPPVARSPGILPSECASRFRGSLSAHPCAHSTRARFLRAPLLAFPPPARRATGGRVRAASCRRSNRSRLLLPRQGSTHANNRNIESTTLDSCLTSSAMKAAGMTSNPKSQREQPGGVHHDL